MRIITEVFSRSRIICAVWLKRGTRNAFLRRFTVGGGLLFALCAQALLVLCMTLSLAVTVNAEQAQQFELDIKQQDVETALNELATQVNALLLFPYDSVQSVESNPVIGQYTIAEALEILLQDTGLSGGFTPGGVITISQMKLIEAHDEPEGEDMNVKKKAGFLASLTAALSIGANAQEAESADEADETVEEIEQIIVTGSRIRGAQSASPMVTITREEIDQAGLATVEEIVEKLPQNFGAGATLDTIGDGVNQREVVGGRAQAEAGGTSINLRGLGASSTLVLLDGRRLSPSGFQSNFTNISSIPVTAIERVEVMTDGASAIYGADAIGGVVNFILRKDFEGAETRLRYGSDATGGTSSILFGQSFGGSWNSGTALLTYEYYDSENLANADRDITSTSDLTRFGGTDWRAIGGNPANIRINIPGFGNQYFAIPAGQDGTALTSADFPVDANGLPTTPPNRYNNRSIGDILPAQERHSAFVHLTQEIGAVELFADARFSTQDTERSDSRRFATYDIDVPDTNPFFVDPTGTGLTTVRVDNYSFENDLPVIQLGEIESLGASLGVRFDFNERWRGELVGNWAREEATRITPLSLDRDALVAAVNQTDPNLAFNPFADGSNTNRAVIDSFVITSGSEDRKYENEVLDFSFHVAGDAFNISGGAVQVATGLEYREETYAADLDRSLFSEGNRDVAAAYAEVFFPIVGNDNSRRGLQRFELSLAARYEDYSDFGDTVNPKVGMVWSPTQSLLLRGTWGTSYRTPRLADLDVINRGRIQYLGQRFVDLGIIPFPIIDRTGPNPNLGPEEAVTWTAGFEWSPERIEGLSIDVTYFEVDFEDRIGSPSGNLTEITSDPRFAPIFNTNPTDEEIIALASDPRWSEARFPAADIIANPSLVGGITDARVRNLAQMVVTGVEFRVAYAFETALGAFNIGLGGDKLFDFKQRLLDSDPLVDEVDTWGRPVDFRARGNLSWSRSDWTVSGFVNYTDSYTDDVNSDPAIEIDSWTTVDLTIAYSTGDTNNVFRNTRFSLSTQNLFDEDPPFVDTLGGLAYDSVNGNPLGRMFALQFNKEW